MKIKLKILILIMLISQLTGCFYQSVDHIEVRKAIAYCKDKRGVDVIRSNFLGYVYVECVNTEGDYIKNILIIDENNE